METFISGLKYSIDEKVIFVWVVTASKFSQKRKENRTEKIRRRRIVFRIIFSRHRYLRITNWLKPVSRTVFMICFSSVQNMLILKLSKIQDIQF